MQSSNFGSEIMQTSVSTLEITEREQKANRRSAAPTKNSGISSVVSSAVIFIVQPETVVMRQIPKPI